MRGIEGKIEAIRYARTRGIPFFGICLGMQCAVVEFARSVLGLDDANSTEFDKDTQHPVIALMEDQSKVRQRGGTMRLGAWPCELAPGSLARAAYGADRISERHRHRYEFNNDYRKRFAEHGLVATGVSPDGNLVEIIELPRASVVPRGAVPPGVQVEADEGTPPLPRLHRRRPGPSRRKPGRI